MTSSSRNLQIVVWAVLAVVLALIGALFVRQAASRSHLPELGQVQSFALTNQLGRIVTLKQLEGKVWVADVIFTRCAGPCPRMTDEMRKLQQSFPANSDLRLVTLTTDPEHDTPSVLKSYSEKFSADFSRWHFLTGPKTEILRNLAIGSLKMSVQEKDESLRENDHDLFIHTTMFVLVDKSGKIRGFYESLEPGFQERIVPDIKSLLRESR